MLFLFMLHTKSQLKHSPSINLSHKIYCYCQLNLTWVLPFILNWTNLCSSSSSNLCSRILILDMDAKGLWKTTHTRQPSSQKVFSGKSSIKSHFNSLLSFHIRPREMWNTCLTFHGRAGVESWVDFSDHLFVLEHVCFRSLDRVTVPDPGIICPAFRMHLYSVWVVDMKYESEQAKRLDPFSIFNQIKNVHLENPWWKQWFMNVCPKININFWRSTTIYILFHKFVKHKNNPSLLSFSTCTSLSSVSFQALWPQLSQRRVIIFSHLPFVSDLRTKELLPPSGSSVQVPDRLAETWLHHQFSGFRRHAEVRPHKENVENVATDLFTAYAGA